MPPRRSSADKAKYFKLRNDGMTLTEACRALNGLDKKTARAWELNMKDSSGTSFRERQQLAKLSGPIHFDDLSKDALRGWEDFEFFRRSMFGRVSSPWQVDAAYKFQGALGSDQKEYINLNCPPGSGKSTLLHDIEAWLTVRNRGIRGMLGSSTQRLATRYAARLRRSLERLRPPDVDPALVAAGMAVDPIASMIQWYGRFQPDNHDLWRSEEFIVAQYGDIAIGEKEPTWQAFGLDTEYLGNRIDIAVWDDVVTKRNMRTAEANEKVRENWDEQAETRLEPRGALFLVGQRLGPTDLYAYNKAKLAGDDFDDDDDWEDFDDDDEPVDGYSEIDPEGSQKARMYHSFVYPAHDEEKCKGLHSTKTPRFWSPDDEDACLLDPIRLSWRELRQKQKRSMESYETVYQQKDVDSGSVLVPRVYVTGGEWQGEQLPGCYDTDRGYQEVPKMLSSDVYSIVTVDPSPTKWWSMQWWLYDQTTELRHFIDMVRQKMEIDDFLTYNPDTAEFSGALEDMWQLSHRKGRDFKYLIIERNAAQRFIGQLEYFKRWCTLRGVSYYPHDTNANKTDDNYGVQVLATHYRHGRYRLPNKQTRGDMGFIITRQLVDEVTVWPEGTTDDCVMAQWFMEWWIPRIATPDIGLIPNKVLPSWQGARRVPASQQLIGQPRVLVPGGTQ